MVRGLSRIARWTAAGVVGVLLLAVLGGVAIGYLSANGSVDRDRGALWLMGPIAVLIMIGATVVNIAWMRTIDEAAREAHKSAWFWGGCTGMGLGGIGVILATLPQAAHWTLPVWLEGRTDPAAYAATGAIGMVFLMVAGYAVAWAVWWWRRR